MKAYAIQDLNSKEFLVIGRGTRWIQSEHGAAQFRLPETARSIARAMVSNYSISYITGEATRIESRERRLAVVPVPGVA